MADRELSLEAWRAEGTMRFGHPDARLWRFVCPACGQVQSYKDLRDIGVPKPERYMGYSCIGRFYLNVPAAADNVVTKGATQGYGCLYAGSEGLAPVLLETGPGEIRRTFEFAP